MIETGIVSKVKIQDVLSNQLPNFIRDESPLTVDFLKQYYISQEYQGGPSDISDNLDQYLNIDNLTPEVIVDSVTTTGAISIDEKTIQVNNTKGFFKIASPVESSLIIRWDKYPLSISNPSVTLYVV